MCRHKCCAPWITSGISLPMSIRTPLQILKSRLTRSPPLSSLACFINKFGVKRTRVSVIKFDERCEPIIVPNTRSDVMPREDHLSLGPVWV